MNQTQTNTQLPSRSKRGRRHDDVVLAGGVRRSGRKQRSDPLDGGEVKGLGRGLRPRAIEAELEAMLIDQGRRLAASAERAIARAEYADV